MIEQDLS
jgi:hypothetical protein